MTTGAKTLREAPTLPGVSSDAAVNDPLASGRRPLDARKSLRRLYVSMDTTAGFVAGAFAGLIGGVGGLKLAPFALGVAFAWVVTAYVTGLYAADDPPSWPAGVAECKRVFTLALALSWPVWGAALLLGATRAGLTGLTTGILLVIGTTALRGTVRIFAQHSEPLRQRAVIIGSGEVARHLIERLRDQPELGLVPVGVVDDDPHHRAPVDVPHLGRRDELEGILRHHDVDRVIIAFSRATHEELLEVIRTCWDAHVAIDVIPRLFELLDGARRVDRVGGLPVMAIDAPSLTGGARALKRVLDFIVSAGLLLALSPILVAVAVAIKVTSRGPVFFRQARAGKDGDAFRLFKFRSMYVDAEERKAELEAANEADDDRMFKIRRDPRITRVGAFLRRTSIDELPQLLNVLAGDMSLVGPRPLILSESASIQGWRTRRLALRPGMTGPWQVYGRSNLPFEDMLRYDYQYVAGWSLARDVEILVATIPAVLSGRGAY